MIGSIVQYVNVWTDGLCTVCQCMDGWSIVQYANQCMDGWSIVQYVNQCMDGGPV